MILCGMDKDNKDCSHCIAYNVDRCAVKECYGALTTLNPRTHQLPDEDIQKIYDVTLSMFEEDFEDDELRDVHEKCFSVNDKNCCAKCEHWTEKYWKCEHPEQLADWANDYDAPPDNVCELFEKKGKESI